MSAWFEVMEVIMISTFLKYKLADKNLASKKSQIVPYRDPITNYPVIFVRFWKYKRWFNRFVKAP